MRHEEGRVRTRPTGTITEASVPRRPCRSKGCTGSRPVVDIGSSRFFDRCSRCARRVLRDQAYPEPDPRPYVNPWSERLAELLAQAEGRWAA